MSSWVPVVCGSVLAILGIAERFYARFVPNVSDQKRHLRIAAWVAFYVWVIIVVGVGFWQAEQVSGPITSQFVFFVAGLFFLLSLAIIHVLTLLLFPTRFYDSFSRFLELFGRHVNLTREEAEILAALAEKTKVPDYIKKKAQNLLEKYDGKTH